MEELTYSFDDSLLPGQIVLVPIGRRVVPGVVVKKVAQPDFKTKSILKVLYSKPLPKHLLKTVKFVHDYYMVPSGQAVSLMLPRGVEKQRRKSKTEQMFGITKDGFYPNPFPEDTLKGARPSLRSSGKGFRAPVHDIPMNVAQKNALEGLLKAPGATKLLYGVTGSGKTNIYLKMASRALLEQKAVMLLVPEIALTGQLVKAFDI